MNDRFDFDRVELPKDLAALDAELSSIRYEERPSFGPELKAELTREWRTAIPRRHWPVRPLMAASVAALLMVGLGVPSARAALVRLVDVVRAPIEERIAPPTTTPSVPLLPFDEPPTGAEEFRVVPPRLRNEPPPARGTVVPSYEGPEATFPDLLDRPGTENLIRDNYPVAFQRRGIGGTVRLRLWVDSTGAVDVADVATGSGVPELDRAAVRVAPSFHFTPARRRGKAVGTWVEFDVRFEPKPAVEDSIGPPVIDPVDRPSVPEMSPEPLASEWRGDIVLPALGQREAGDVLRSALGDDAGVRRLGPIDAILKGDPPAGAAPTQWRSEVSEALEAAIARAPDNPAPLLALARIRRKQGLRTESRMLYERGLQRAQRVAATLPPILLADLYYERGLLVRESWLGSRNAGHLPADALSASACPQARSSGGALSGFASVDRLIAWNYLCPEALGAAFESAFEPSTGNAEANKAVMMASFRSAVEAYPAHPGANLEMLLELADEGRWAEVLEGARRFTRASEGHPYGLLMTGLALQRLSRTEDAEGQFRLAVRSLPAAEVAELEDVSKLLDPAQTAQFWKASGDARGAWIGSFWDRLDPILSTPVNERRVEHVARAAYAHLRFGSALSDPGEVWVRYGRPTHVRVIAEGTGVRTEFWDYGSGPDITFRRMAASENLELTSEGRTYVDELRQVFPHRYGTGSRLVFSLPGQVTRFRGVGVGASDVVVHTQVPALPATASRDTLDLNVFLLGAEGEKLDMVQRLMSAEPSAISLEAPAAAEVSDVVVEVFNRRTGQAAALRDSVHAAESVAGATMSDLLLTEPASPTPQAVRRDAPWMQPLTLAGPVATHEVGVFFELYDVASLAAWYRLRAEAENRATGEVIALGIRPAGEDRLRPTWERRPNAEGATAEYVSVWLGDLPAGSWTLRIVADLPEAGAPLVAERRIERR
jgi:TonB family protein